MAVSEPNPCRKCRQDPCTCGHQLIEEYSLAQKLPYELLEHPHVATGGGSGMRTREISTPFGEFRAIHWNLSGGRCLCTELAFNDHRPKIKIAGHIDLKGDLVKLYFEKLFQFGGISIVFAFIEQIAEHAHSRGFEEAKRQIRNALGLP